MRKIHILPPLIANQIAAGEVIERPASVIKELIENSLDAKASKIDIEVTQGGFSCIKVSDDGEGIAKEDLPLSLQRHATSKVLTLQDLQNIATLGFRGEALASIASISKCLITSKTINQTQAWSCSVQGENLTPYLFPGALHEGTRIEISDIFYNAPARRKFLKSSRTEFQHIERVVKNMALCNPQVQVRLVHNDKQIRYYKKTSLKQRIQQIAGNHFFQNAVELHVDHQNWQLIGFVGTAQALRKNSDLQHVFINNRCVKDRIIHHAIKNAFYECNSVLENAFLSFILFLECPLEEVDINVHPTKAEVRFHDATWVHDFIQKNIEKSFRATVPKQQAFCVSSLAPTKCYEREPHSIASSLTAPPLEPAQFIWEHFYVEGGQNLYIIDLEKNQKIIWERLMKERYHFSFPKNLILFPRKLYLEQRSATLLKEFSFTLQDNAMEKSLLCEKPAFLHEEEMNELLQRITTTSFVKLESTLCDFFKQLSWPVFLRHNFFKQRFSAWCKSTSKSDFIVSMDPKNLQAWITSKLHGTIID